MHRTVPIVTALVLVSVLAAAVPAGAQDTPQPVTYAAEDAAFHAEWAANDTEGFAENHTTNPHRDPLAHSLWLTCWSVDDAGAAVGPVAQACAPFYQATEPSPPVEEQDADAEAGEDGGAGQAASEAAQSATTLADDLQEDPLGAPDHAAAFLSRTLTWVEDHVLERVRDLVGGAVDTTGAGVDASLDLVAAAAQVPHAAADASATASRSAVEASAASVGAMADASTAAIQGAAATVTNAAGTTVDASASLVESASRVVEDALARVGSLWSGDDAPVPDDPATGELPVGEREGSSLLEDVRDRVPLKP